MVLQARIRTRLGRRDGYTNRTFNRLPRWPARVQTKNTQDLPFCILNAWIMVCGTVKRFTSGGDKGLKGKEVEYWAMSDQVALKHQAPHQTTWLVERNVALVRSTARRADAKVANESACNRSNIVLGLVTFEHGALVPINGHTPHQIFLGRHPNQSPPPRTGTMAISAPGAKTI